MSPDDIRGKIDEAAGFLKPAGEESRGIGTCRLPKGHPAQTSKACWRRSVSALPPDSFTSHGRGLRLARDAFHTVSTLDRSGFVNYRLHWSPRYQLLP